MDWNDDFHEEDIFMKNISNFLLILSMVVVTVLLSGCSYNDVFNNSDEKKSSVRSIAKRKASDDEHHSHTKHEKAKKEKVDDLKKNDSQTEQMAELSLADDEVPFISQDKNGELAVYKINLTSNEITSLGKSIITDEFIEKVSELVMTDLSNYKVPVYWDGKHSPVFVDGKKLVKGLNISDYIYATPQGYLIEKDGVYMFKSRYDSTGFVKIFDFKSFIESYTVKRYGKDAILLNFEKVADDKYRFLFNFSKVVEGKSGKELAENKEKVVMIETDAKNCIAKVLKNEADNLTIFEKFDSFTKTKDGYFTKLLKYDIKNGLITKMNRDIATEMEKIAQKFEKIIDFESPNDDGGVADVVGVSGKYQITYFGIDSGKYNQYLYYVVNQEEVIKCIAYKDGVVTIFDSEGNVLKEYKDMQFGYMLFALPNKMFSVSK